MVFGHFSLSLVGLIEEFALLFKLVDFIECFMPLQDAPEFPPLGRECGSVGKDATGLAIVVPNMLPYGTADVTSVVIT